ncbi:MAG: DUF371 domain-containing protein [archaeon]|nr:DUF371 domain-containing protein [archaeon]MCP8313470.1 DUF371 domain-containing protein [archaeon]
MKLVEVVEFFGHPLIRATHKTTFEITKEEKISLKGDCIVGVKANKSCKDLDDRLKRLITNNIPIKITIHVGKYVLEANAMGDPSLILNDEKDIVIRKSNYVCPRTLAVKSDKAAIDIPRDMILMLNKNDTKGKMIISVNY